MMNEEDIIRLAAQIHGRRGGKLGGKARTARKRAASRRNGKLGGRPKQPRPAAGE